MNAMQWTIRIGLAGLLALAGCGGTGDPSDGGSGDGDGGLDQCAVDNSRGRPATEPDWQLVPDGEPATGFICPKSDVDHYWFEVASAGTILTVELADNVTMSPVDLCYKVLPEDENGALIGQKCDEDGMDGVTELVGRHYLAEAGTYFLEIRDAASDDEDARNPYRIALSQVVDPDQNEPNNDQAQATSLTGSAEGYLSFLGDEDWFAIEVSGSGKILSLDLTTAAASPVDLRYTLLAPDGTTPINTGVDADGSDGPSALSDVLSVAEAGTYYLVITDELTDDSDVEVGYSLQIQIDDNPDPRDRTDDNDSPLRATDISSGTTVSDAYLATRADQDWYRIEAPGVSDTAPALLEIDLELQGSSPVDPAVDLIVGDPNTACNQGDACDTLSWTCSCNTAECRNAQCPSHECLEHENLCRGAGFCLPEGGCGIRHLIMHGADWSTDGNPRHLHTVAPMYGSTYYFQVRDFMGDDVDPTTPYHLTVTVIPEPDGNEPNGLYLPYVTNEQDEETRSWNTDRATPVSCSDLGDHIECGPIEGYLSYRGDQDWYRIDGFPAEDEPAPDQQSLKVDYDLQFDWSFSGSAELNINYILYVGGLDAGQMGWNHTGPGTGTFGDSDCAYLCGEYHGSRPMYFQVQHSDRKKWDYTQPYSVTIRAYRTCPLVCSYCQPGTDLYPCPTPDNPCPSGDCQ